MIGVIAEWEGMKRAAKHHRILLELVRTSTGMAIRVDDDMVTKDFRKAADWLDGMIDKRKASAVPE